MAAIGLSDERAARFMFALRDGTTPHIFGVNSKSLETYFAAHPDYASEARPLIEANAKAARHRKGDKLRSTTHCRAGLHLMSGDNVFIDGTHGRRRCLACRRASTAKAEEMRPEVVAVVKAALQNGATFSHMSGKACPRWNDRPKTSVDADQGLLPAPERQPGIR
jgi:hypothetical protein